jgi:ABC-type uncharacterized transport system auxiliary subunit
VIRTGSFGHQLAAVVLCSVLFSGCGRVRYPTTYVLNFPRAAPHATSPQAMLGAVVVREFKCPQYLCDGRIVFRPTPEEVGFYEFHRWAVDPRESITLFLANTLRARSIFTHVASQERGITAAYILTGSIDRMEEVDRGRSVHAECEISAQLVDPQTGSVVWSDTASVSVAVERRNIAGVVNSLTTAAQIAVERLVTSMADQLVTQH